MKNQMNIPMNIQTRIQDILNDPATSHWLRDALTSALQRDPIDAADDADTLTEILRDWAGLV